MLSTKVQLLYLLLPGIQFKFTEYYEAQMVRTQLSFFYY